MSSRIVSNEIVLESGSWRNWTLSNEGNAIHVRRSLLFVQTHTLVELEFVVLIIEVTSKTAVFKMQVALGNLRSKNNHFQFMNTTKAKSKKGNSQDPTIE